MVALGVTGGVLLYLGVRLYPADPPDERAFRLPEDEADRRANRWRAVRFAAAGLVLLVLAATNALGPLLAGVGP